MKSPIFEESAFTHEDKDSMTRTFLFLKKKRRLEVIIQENRSIALRITVVKKQDVHTD